MSEVAIIAADHHLQRFDRQTLYAGDCIVWTGTTTRNGYGQFRYDFKRVLAHRFAYERFIGPIPDGLHIDHLCRCRSCVNPAHLEPVTPRENIIRGISQQARNAKKTHCIKGHAFDEGNTSITRRGNRACKACNRIRVLAFFHKKKRGAACKK